MKKIVMFSGLIALVLLASCTKKEVDEVVNTITEPAPVETDDSMMDDDDSMEKTADAMMDGNQEASADVELDVTGVNFAFSQEEIRVKKWQTVTINFESTEGFHDWVVDEFAAATQKVNPGTPTSVTFVADTAWEFEYYCSVGAHRANGMVGRLIVEEDAMMKDDAMEDDKMMDDDTAMEKTDDAMMDKEEDVMEKEDSAMMDDQDDTMMAKAGTYTDYAPALVGENENTVIAFFAGWCPSCVSADKNISAAEIPEGLTVLKADFDSETDLRKKYGVTGQHTFVQVDANGDLVKKWVGGTTVDDIVEKL